MGSMSRSHAGLQVLDGSVQAVAVRAGERGGAVRCGRLGKLLRPGDPVVGAEGGGDVEVGEAHAVRARSAVVDPQQPPAAAADMPGQVKGEVDSAADPAVRKRTWTRQISWSTRPGPLPSGCPAFLGPPLAALVPADGVRADRVAPAGPVEVQGLAGGRADDVHGLAEHAPVGRLPDLALGPSCELADALNALDYSNISSNKSSLRPEPRQNPDQGWTDEGAGSRIEP